MNDIILNTGEYKITFEDLGNKSILITDAALFAIITMYMEQPYTDTTPTVFGNKKQTK